MTNSEMVELLREKAEVSEAEAQDALERSNWDLLDAMLLLEREGKVSLGGGSYSTKPEEEEAPRETEAHSHREGARSAVRWLGQTFVKLVRMGNSNSFVVSHKGEELFSLPVTVFAVVMLFCFWFLIAALIVGLFCGLRYSFRGPNLGKQSINNAMDRAAKVAENVKEELRAHAEGSDKTAEQESDADDANDMN